MMSLAVALYSGESQTITLPEQYDYYTIVGNSTQIDLTIEQDGLNITITISKYQQSDNFEIIFFNKEKEVITKTVYTGSGGGGGSSTTTYKTIFRDRDKIIYEPEYIDKEKIVNKTVIERIPQDLSWKIVTIFATVMFLSGILACLVFFVIKYVRERREEDYDESSYYEEEQSE